MLLLVSSSILAGLALVTLHECTASTDVQEFKLLISAEGLNIEFENSLICFKNLIPASL